MNFTQYQWVADHINAYAKKYIEFKNYYKGDHPDVITDVMRKAFGDMFGELKDNLCPSVVDTVCDRLQFIGWSSSDDKTNKLLSEYYKAHKVATKGLRLVFNGIMYGDAYLIVWADSNGVPSLFVQDTPNMAVEYDSDGTMLRAAKVWVENIVMEDGKDKPRARMTVYYPDKIERFASKPGDSGIESVEPYCDDGDYVFANPFGKVPVFHFSNALSVGDFASSELTEAVSIQNQLNKAILDLSVACEYSGFRQRWATGIEIPRDPETNQPVELFKSAIDRIWTSPSPDTQFGEFSETDLSKLLEVIQDKRGEMARVTRTPVHLMMLNTGNFPSGEALKTAEAPLSAKVKARKLIWGDVWEEVGAFICKIAGFDGVDINAVWENTEPHSEIDATEIGKNKLDLGVSKTQVRRELGYTDEEIADMDKENEADLKRTQERAEAAFNSAVIGE